MGTKRNSKEKIFRGWKKIWRVPMTDMARKKGESIDSNGNTK